MTLTLAPHRQETRPALASKPVTVAMLSTIVAISCLSGTNSPGAYRSDSEGPLGQRLLLVRETASTPVLSHLVTTDDSATMRTSKESQNHAIRGDQAEIVWTKENSGLTWDQLGKVLGVSRRAVHMWATGARMNQTHAERLREFSAAVRANLGATPDETRAALLSIGPDGLSMVERYRNQRLDRSSWGNPFSPEELAGTPLGSEIVSPSVA